MGPGSCLHRQLRRAPRQQQQLVKQVLSRELQLYYAQLTSSLLPLSSDLMKRMAALASLTRCGFTGTLALPCKVGWRGRSRYPKRRLTKRDRWAQVLFDMTSTLLENNTLFIEPYVSPPFPHHLTPTNQSTAPPNLPPNLLHPPCP